MSSNLQVSPWELVESAVPAGSDIPVRESIFTVGNGFVAMRGYHDAAKQDASNNTIAALPCANHSFLSPVAGPATSSRGTYVNGIYDERPIQPQTSAFSFGDCQRECFMVSVPDAASVEFRVGQDLLSLTGDAGNPMAPVIDSHYRALDLRSGELRRTTTWASKTSPGRSYTLEERRIACYKKERKNVIAMAFKLTTSSLNSHRHGTDVRIQSEIVVPIGADGHASLEIQSRQQEMRRNEGLSFIHARTCKSRSDVIVASNESCTIFSPSMIHSLSSDNTPVMLASPAILGGSAPALQQTAITPVFTQLPSAVRTTFSSVIGEQSVLTFNKYVSYVVQADGYAEELAEKALEAAQNACVIGYSTLLEEQRAELESFWSAANATISCKHDMNLQGALRFNMLQLFMSAGRSKNCVFGPRGLTGELFGGLQTSDTEIFVLPFFVHAAPEIARALLTFRTDTLPQAVQRARDLQFARGALYPYQTVNGMENAPLFSGAFHLHVNGDIAYAIKQYFQATQDWDFMSNEGISLIWTTALLYLECGSWEKEQFHLRGVTGPDEYNVLVSNNYYTNLMAQHHLLFAVELYESLSKGGQQQQEDLLLSLMQCCEIRHSDFVAMKLAAAQIALPYDPTLRIHLKDESFLRKRRWPQGRGRETQDTLGPLMPMQENAKGYGPSVMLHQYHPLVVFRHRVCKTADVVLASVLLPNKLTHDEKKANFDYYEQHTSHDSSLTYPTLSIMASELQFKDKAMNYFLHSLNLDLNNELKNTSGGLHTCALAGSWACLVMGFGGFRVVDGMAHLSPYLPDRWTQYKFQFRHQRAVVAVEVTRFSVSYQLVEGPVNKISLIHAQSTRVHLTRGAKPIVIKFVKDVRNYDFDAVVFDAESIIHQLEDDHYEAWRRTLDPVLQRGDPSTVRPFTLELYLAYMRHHAFGNSKRYAGLQRFLKQQGIELPPGDATDNGPNTLNGLIKLKLSNFRTVITERGVKIRDGALALIRDLRESGIAVGCVSASKNGRWIMQQLPDLLQGCDVFFDGNDEDKDTQLRWRPELDYFDKCTKLLDCTPRRVIVFLDGIDGWSQKSLQQYHLVVNTWNDPLDANSAEEFVPSGFPYMRAPDLLRLTAERLAAAELDETPVQPPQSTVSKPGSDFPFAASKRLDSGSFVGSLGFQIPAILNPNQIST